ncbi:hypothetical protein OB955_15470 [Halobacteria archaeon AArc-m2/3/4]|uniref:Uncharacterized protein n=1 Tax=Natronoglomus mannanivorans TaxID=2979990 RepID=A0AAP2YZU5_9EURY|nr:hypothetical protein [Halobacteria archaeon AArc-xg1-1]MCU4974128.1 hypothetical protein [Halobacteria archaeon AArc-m2/3/4]
MTDHTTTSTGTVPHSTTDATARAIATGGSGDREGRRAALGGPEPGPAPGTGVGAGVTG